MTRAQTKAGRLRWLLLIAALLCWIIGALTLLFPRLLDWTGTGGTPDFLNALIYVGIFLMTQWFFLRPRGCFKFHSEDLARPLVSRKIAGGFMAMVLSTAWIATLLELPNWWKEVCDFDGGIIIIWIAMGILWLIWNIIFFIYWKQADSFDRMGKIIRALLVGSVLNVFISTWVFIRNPHEQDCYCTRGSFTGLVFGTTVLLWTFGPGLVLLFLREKNRREKLVAASSNP